MNRKCIACTQLVPTRACTRCAQVKPVTEFGRSCRKCRACADLPAPSVMAPRYCLRCAEMKPVSEFSLGPGKRNRRNAGLIRRHRGICKQCVRQERAERQKRHNEWRATWEQGGVTVRRCSKCDEVKNLEEDFYVTRRTEKRAYKAYVCKRCTIARAVEQKRRQVADPATRDAELAVRRGRAIKWRRANPERYRAAQERYRDTVRADPVKSERRREDNRLAYRLRRERQGANLEELRRPNVEMSQPRERVEVAPLLAWLKDYRYAGGFGWDELAQRVTGGEHGTWARRFHRWRTGDQRVIEFGVADELLTRLGVQHLAEVFWPDL